jgi:hypothetical protein
MPGHNAPCRQRDIEKQVLRKKQPEGRGQADVARLSE